MNELSVTQVLDLMRHGPQSFRTLQATRHDWTDVIRRRDAFEQLREQAENSWVHPPFLEGPEAPEKPRVREARCRIRVSQPGLVRIDRQGTHDSEGRPLGYESAETTIVNGERWWTLITRSGRLTVQAGTIHETNPVHRELEFFMQPIFHSYTDYRLAGLSSFEGREVMRLIVVPPIQKTPEVFIWHPIYGDNIELLVDREKGLVLRAAARVGGVEIDMIELLDPTFDESIDAQIFQPEIPAGHPVRAWKDFLPRDVSLEEASRLAGFDVLVPTYLPPGVEIPETDRQAFYGPLEKGVLLSYLWPESRPQCQLMIDESREEPSPEDLEDFPGLQGEEESLEAFDEVARQGQTLHILERRSRKGSPWFTVRTERDGVHISMNSMFDRETTLKIAFSLTPAASRA